jgi:hypothetical protein
MALLGKGVLAIWNGMQPGYEDEFTRWHVQEHIPERVNLPGFERGRRYRTIDGHPAFFNFYETRSVADLESPAYKERLNNPTPWTLATVKQFTDTSRTLCDVVVTRGTGQGTFIETLAMDTLLPDEALITELNTSFEKLSATSGIVGVHLLRGLTGKDQALTEEKKLRGVPDQEVAWLLLIEAIDLDPLILTREQTLTNIRLTQSGSTNIKRGIYQLQYALGKDELQRTR